MDTNGLQTILTASPVQLQMLERKLSPGQAYGFHLHAGQHFIPPSVPAYVRPTVDGYELRLAHPVQYYDGNNSELRQLAHDGYYAATSLSEVVAFIRHNFGPMANKPNGSRSRQLASEANDVRTPVGHAEFQARRQQPVVRDSEISMEAGHSKRNESQLENTPNPNANQETALTEFISTWEQLAPANRSAIRSFLKMGCSMLENLDCVEGGDSANTVPWRELALHASVTSNDRQQLVTDL